MNKKVLAIALALVMILGLIPALTTVIPPVNAAAAYPTPYDATCHNRALPNTGFAGAYPLDAASPFCVFLQPGIADAYNPGWSHTLGTLWGFDYGTTQARQVLDKYLDYAILASGSDSIGDLQFTFSLMSTNVSAIRIYVMPEFKFKGATAAESVWTDITNDYSYVSVGTRSAYDKIAPGWTSVEIGKEGGWNMTTGIYHVRLLDLSAPSVAGLFFFKIAWFDSYDNFYILNAIDYPFVVVKTDLNPAYIQVTVRTNGKIAAPYVSGEVIATGTTPDGRSVLGATTWGRYNFQDNSAVPGNVGAEYMSYIFGLAAGTYTLTAQGSGFLPTTTDRMTVDAGQSYQTYIVINYSPEVSVTVWSKHGTGAVPWGNLWQLPYGTNNPDVINVNATWRDIMLELYDSNNNLLAFWASDVLGGATKAEIAAGPSPAWLHGVTGSSKSIADTTKLFGIHDDEAPNPTAVSYSAKLCDNFDVLGNLRMYPSTQWDGHVPWSTADYIGGYPNGQYTVEAYVTGYIMDQADAYQRAFSLVGSSMNLQFDLRRSNWLDVSMHLPASGTTKSGWTELSVPTTVTLTAEDSAGSERGAIAFLANATMCKDGLLDGMDASAYYNNVTAPKWTPANGINPHVDLYTGGIIIEGWNALFPNLHGDSSARDIHRKDYGLNPTASTHSAGAVTLAGNPYTVKLYMADMGIPYDPPFNNALEQFPAWNATGWYSIVGGDSYAQASVFLCNSRVSLSFSITSAHVVISLRSVDFEVPAHSRPWTFPGSEIYVDFMDTATGKVVASLDPTIYGLFQDPGWNSTLTNYWHIPGVVYPNAKTGWYDLGWTPFDIDNVNPAGQHEHLLVPFYGIDYCSHTIDGWDSIYNALVNYRSTRLPAGEYTFEAHTHGYIMRQASETASYPVQIPQSGEGDIEADMIQGGQIRVTADFLHEAVPTAFNGLIYAEVFDSAGNFVGASIYGQAQPNYYTRVLNGGGYLDYAPGNDFMVQLGPAQATGLNGTTPANCDKFPSCSMPQRAFFAWFFHTYNGGAGFGYPPLRPAPVVNTPATTWANWQGLWWDMPKYTISPPTEEFPPNRVEVPAGSSQAMDIYGFYQYTGNAVRTWAGGWPVPAAGGSAPQVDSGLKGSVDLPGLPGSGAGLYSVKVWAFDSRGPDDLTANPWVGGSTTYDDWRMYSMATELTNVQIPWGGAVSLSVDMNDMAKLTGTVSWFDMYNNLVALPWAQVTASPGPSTDQYSAYQTSNYVMWVPVASQDVSVSTSEAPQVWSSAAPTVNAAFTVVVTSGGVFPNDSSLSTSGTPVPEVPAFAAPLALFAVLAASVWLLRKKNYNIPVVMK